MIGTRLPVWMIAGVGVFAGCTAIIDGTLDAPETGPTMAHGSQSQHGTPGGSGGDAGAVGTDGGSSELPAPSASPGAAGAESAGAPNGPEAASGAGGATSDTAPGEAVGGLASHESGGAAQGGTRAELGGAASADAGSDGGVTTPGGATGSGGNAGIGGRAGTAGTTGTGAAGGSDAASGALPPGDPVHGHQLVALSNCYRCHADNLAGRGFYRNITPDIETGIGGWTDRQIADAIRGAIGPTGELFCASMPLYSGFKAQDTADVIAFLRGIPAVSNKITLVCPGHDP